MKWVTYRWCKIILSYMPRIHIYILTASGILEGGVWRATFLRQFLSYSRAETSTYFIFNSKIEYNNRYIWYIVLNEVIFYCSFYTHISTVHTLKNKTIRMHAIQFPFVVMTWTNNENEVWRSGVCAVSHMRIEFAAAILSFADCL